MWPQFLRRRDRNPRSWRDLPSALPPRFEGRGPFRDRRIDLFRIGGVLLVAWTVNSLILSDHGFLRLRELRTEEAEKSLRRAALIDTVSTLERDERESKQERQERMAREKYKQSRSDEIVYLFDRRTPSAAPAVSDSATGTEARERSDTR